MQKNSVSPLIFTMMCFLVYFLLFCSLAPFLFLQKIMVKHLCMLTNLACSRKTAYCERVHSRIVLYESVLARYEAVATRTKQREPKHQIYHTYIHFVVKYHYQLSCGVDVCSTPWTQQVRGRETSTYSYCLSGHFWHGGSLSNICTYMHVRTLSRRRWNDKTSPTFPTCYDILLIST